jgi:secondary thiamine-phosphate synthase enzyme
MKGNFDILNITNLIQEYVSHVKIKSGCVLVFYQHSTGAAFIAEHEAGIFVDLEEILESIVPRNQEYMHHLSGVDENGYAHIRSAIMNNTIVIPVDKGNLLLGKYQDIFIVDMQTDVEARTCVLQVMGK